MSFSNDLDSLRDLLIRVLHVACIELWELWGAWVLTRETYDHRATHPHLVVHYGTGLLVLVWAMMICSPW